MLVAVSCGAAVLASLKVRLRQELKDTLIVSILASFWENLLNSALFEGLQKEAVSMTAAVTP